MVDRPLWENEADDHDVHQDDGDKWKDSPVGALQEQSRRPATKASQLLMVWCVDGCDGVAVYCCVRCCRAAELPLLLKRGAITILVNLRSPVRRAVRAGKNNHCHNAPASHHHVFHVCSLFASPHRARLIRWPHQPSSKSGGDLP